MSAPLYAGCTLHIDSGPDEKKHLCICVYDPKTIDKIEKILVAPICSAPTGVTYDQSCVLNVMDHPFIKHDSYIAYNKCTVYRADDAKKHLNSGYFTYGTDASTQLLVKVLNGMTTSDRVPRYILKDWL